MENQHRKIVGYKELTQDDIDLMNKVKEMGKTIGALVEALSTLPNTDPRWLEIGKQDLQKGLMSLTRSITKPDFF